MLGDGLQEEPIERGAVTLTFPGVQRNGSCAECVDLYKDDFQNKYISVSLNKWEKRTLMHALILVTGI